MQFTEDPNLDSDLYLVPNPHGPGKTVVRRAHPPPTTVPLDDDFDAATVEDSTVYQGPRPADAESNVADSERNMGQRRETYHADAKEYGLGNKGPTTGKLSSLELGLGGVPAAASVKSSAGDGGIAQARPRSSMAKEIDGRRDSKISSTKKSAADEGRKSRREGGSRNGGGGGNDTHRVSVAKGLPEEVPSVTTWRQQVAISRNLDETQSSCEDGDDDITETGRTASRARRRPSNEDMSQRGADKKGSDGKSTRDGQMSSVGSPSIGAQSPGKSKVSRTNSKYINPVRSERMYSIADLNVPPPPPPPPPASELTLSESATETASVTSGRQKHTRDHSQASTSIRAYPLVNRPVSSAPADLTPLHGFLSSFQPSLLHVAPILVALGIREEEHLRAVAGLSEETRNREVREVALEKGMTVLEWAMLLDKTRVRP